MDKIFSEVLTGSVWALAARILATGLTLLASIIVARLYGAQMLGIVAVVQALLMSAMIISVLGTNMSVLRLIPEHIAKCSATSAFKVYQKIQYFVAALSFLVGFLLFFLSDFIAVNIFSKPHLSFYFSLASGVVVFRSLMELNTQAVRGLRLIRVFAFMQVLPSATLLLALFVITILHGGRNSPVYAHFIAWVSTALIGIGIVNHFFRKIMLTEDIITTISLKKILSISTPMLMTSSMQFVIGQTGIIILGIFKDEVDVGQYVIAFSLASLTSFVLTAINSIVAPKFADLYHKGEMEDLFYVAKKSTRLIFFTTIPILVGLVVLGKPILGILYGEAFTVAYPALLLLIIGQFINSISGSTGIFLNMTGHEKVLRNVMIVSGVINILISLVLIPLFGIIGAACAGMVTLICWNLYILFYIKRKYGHSIGYFPFLVGS